jgi:hypothetical protein
MYILYTQYIGNFRCSVIALYSPFGFLYWKIIPNTTNALIFQDFVLEIGQNVQLSPDAFCILDNCAIHKTRDSILVLENVFRGQWRNLAAYSPDWNPIELGFSQVKRFLRRYENNYLVDPLTTINAAFYLYSTNGARSFRAMGNWNKYRRNYIFYNDIFV